MLRQPSTPNSWFGTHVGNIETSWNALEYDSVRDIRLELFGNYLDKTRSVMSFLELLFIVQWLGVSCRIALECHHYVGDSSEYSGVIHTVAIECLRMLLECSRMTSEHRRMSLE